MPKISDEKRAARRAQILEAAWTCFQEEGLHATTMDDIIRTSGLSAGAVYSYYPSKDDLILAAVTKSLAGLSALVEPILKAEPPFAPPRLVGEMAAAIEGFTTRQGYDLKRIALLGWAEAQRNEALRETMRGFYLAARTMIEATALRWQAAGWLGRGVRVQDIAKTVLALILGYVVQAAIIGDISPSDMEAGVGSLP